MTDTELGFMAGALAAQIVREPHVVIDMRQEGFRIARAPQERVDALVVPAWFDPAKQTAGEIAETYATHGVHAVMITPKGSALVWYADDAKPFGFHVPEVNALFVAEVTD